MAKDRNKKRSDTPSGDRPAPKAEVAPDGSSAFIPAEEASNDLGFIRSVAIGVIVVLIIVYIAYLKHRHGGSEGALKAAVETVASMHTATPAAVPVAPTLPTKENKGYVTVGTDWVELPIFVPENFRTELETYPDADFQFKDKDWDSPISVIDGGPQVAVKNQHMFRPLVRMKSNSKVLVAYYCVKER